MSKVTRRSVLELLASLPLLSALGCSTTPKADPAPGKSHTADTFKRRPGRLSIIQGPTSKTEALINVFIPRMQKYYYWVEAPGSATVEFVPYQTVTGPTFYKIEKVKVTGLKPGVEYTLKVADGPLGKGMVVDERKFGSLDTSNPAPRFAFLSCMSDHTRFEDVIDPMWARLAHENPDFLILNGDIVYVDYHDFVERDKATEYDLWQRYLDAFQRIPLYHWAKLKPVFATWDDHDYGSNDSDRTFQSAAQITKLFQGAFGGQPLDGIWNHGPRGVTSELTAFGQRFYFMDDRSFRQPNKDQKIHEPFGHWGREQHEWLLARLHASDQPAWIINGNQFFNGKSLAFKEAFEENHPVHFVKFLEQLKTVKAPVVFGSGDIHFSEIMKIPAARAGLDTFEVTSSSMHSFTGDGWDNPMRLDGAVTREFNFLIIESRAQEKKLDLRIQAIGLNPQPYFEKSLNITRA